ncbi:mannitol dehydrogenase family protein [Nesterenkonia xinjiangensis]|uniref:Mannitol-1-phosphate 5-dehydrogenase n=1 Tax=Nesterenkonia xinjiangensis TaxID=225327 RepID=A0A7Z0KAB4_9MICC|nr:mannitol dehydrogenase family protein [Nesterenkonia xinjiangensis]NYJ78110.1 mannitol 2-dehydrogenase [Nesterenkonia xinjiangensis]
MTAATPLSARTVTELGPDTPSGVALRTPDYPLEGRRVGIVHFGVGGFHRAHQALYLDRLFSGAGRADWAVCGVGLLPGDVRMRDALVPQDGLYTLVSTGPDGTRDARVIGSIAEYLYAPEDPEAVLARMTDEGVKIVSLTVTEGGYNYSPTTGEFLTETPAAARDLARGEGEHPETFFGFIVEALRRRRAAGTKPFTVLSCDNIRGNGDLAQRMILAFAQHRDAELAAWIRQDVAFPNCMVDRITPVTTEADRAMVAEECGVDDAWPVVSEDFLQWVLEDRFPAGRPAFEEVGVQMVHDVEPYELMKLRLLNCSHQVIAYFGLLLGHTYAHEACQDEVLVRFTRELYMDREGTPTVPEVPGIDLEAYKDQLIARFGNEHVRDTLARLAAESSDRIPTWMVPVIRENLAAGRDVSACAAVVASWARYAEGVGENGEEWPVVDRLRERVMAAAAQHDDDILIFLRDEELFGDLVEHQAFTRPYAEALTTLREQGARALLERSVG